MIGFRNLIILRWFLKSLSALNCVRICVAYQNPNSDMVAIMGKMFRPVSKVVFQGILLAFVLHVGPKVLNQAISRMATWLKLEKEQELNQLQLTVDNHKPPETWNRVFMFPNPFHFEPDSGISELLDLIKSAEFSIQIVMYLVSYQRLETVLARKLQQGCVIQIVTDYDTLTAHQNITVWNLKKLHGVRVRAQRKEKNFMHHKFIIIDEEAVMTGSLNWTKNGITENRENVLVTTDQRLVQPYLYAFRTLWEEGKDIDMLIPPKKTISDSVIIHL